MPYNPATRTPTPPYWCPNCEAWFVINADWFNLNVMTPGSCEHSGETKLIPEPAWVEPIRAVFGERYQQNDTNSVRPTERTP